MTPSQLRDILVAAGLPAALWFFPDRTFEPCSVDFVGRNYDFWLDALPEECVVFVDAAGKKLRLRPKWVEAAGDCDNIAIGLMAHAQAGNWKKAARGEKRGGLAYGMLFYTAEPRGENGGADGEHAINWFVDHEGRLRFFDGGLGGLVDLTPSERGSSWFAIAS